MKKNVGLIDRGIRFVAGIVLLAWAIAGGPYWTWIGVIPLATAAWSFCPLYTALGITTRKKS